MQKKDKQRLTRKHRNKSTELVSDEKSPSSYSVDSPFWAAIIWPGRVDEVNER